MSLGLILLIIFLEFIVLFRISTPKIYFFTASETRNLQARHNQSPTNTDYYGDGFMANFGGSKDGLNVDNYQYIWTALQAVVTDKV